MQHEIGHKLNKRPRPEGYIEDNLKKILKFLSNSCRDYDAGDEDEAIRMALELRKLLYDGGSSHALLTQWGVKNTLRFVDTGIYPRLLDIALQEFADERENGQIALEGNPGLSGLVTIKFDSNGAPYFAPPLGESVFHQQDPRRKAYGGMHSFDSWWDAELVKASSGRIFSRKNLILIIANQDAGAHVDPELDADFQDLCVDNLGIQARVGVSKDEAEDFLSGEGEPIPAVSKNLPYASIRQIVFEVQTTIERYLQPVKPGQMLLAQPYSRTLVERPILGPYMTLATPVLPESLAEHRARVFSHKPTDWETRSG